MKMNLDRHNLKSGNFGIVFCCDWSNQCEAAFGNFPDENGSDQAVSGANVPAVNDEVAGKTGNHKNQRQENEIGLPGCSCAEHLTLRT